MTLRQRLFYWLLPALLLLMLGGTWVDFRAAGAALQDADDRALVLVARTATAELHPGNGGGPIGATELAATLSRLRGGSLLLSVRDARGGVIAGLPDLPVLTPLRSAATGPLVATVEYRGSTVRLAQLQVPTQAGMARVLVGEDVRDRERSGRLILLEKILVDFMQLNVVLLVVWIAIHLALEPLERLRSQIEQDTIADLSLLDERSIPGELRPLTRAFNRVLSLLREVAQSQRRFIADAAHQLKTPLAGLSAQLELLRDDPRAAGLKAELGTLERGIQRLTHRAQQLLALARAEPAASTSDDFELLDLQALVIDLIERNVERATKAGIDLGVEAQPATILGNDWLLEDLLGNLLDNALKYTPAGGRVTVRCGIQGDQALLEVEDDGPGIPLSERGRVRERFYRRPDTAGEGCGLGLAIVEQIARRHRGTLAIATPPGGRGTLMQVRFAARPQPTAPRESVTGITKPET